MNNNSHKYYIWKTALELHQYKLICVNLERIALFRQLGLAGTHANCIKFQVSLRRRLQGIVCQRLLEPTISNFKPLDTLSAYFAHRFHSLVFVKFLHPIQFPVPNTTCNYPNLNHYQEYVFSLLSGHTLVANI